MKSNRRASGTPSGASSASTLTPRGFTGHEMVDGMQVIHMNGRIYDPQLGRFLQPDPVIQEPTNAQSWNAYTYVFNNPLAYTDPGGMMSERAWNNVWRGLGLVISITATAVASPCPAEGPCPSWWLQCPVHLAPLSSSFGVGAQLAGRL
ncbi:RHS repeat domain-containing protein [Pseudoxanthomonas mexicana]